MKLSRRLRIVLPLFVSFASLLLSCNKEGKEARSEKEGRSTDYRVKYAKGFDIEYFDSYKKLIIKSPYPDSDRDLVYTLVADRNAGNNDGISIEIPLSRIVATSTTHVPMIEKLGAAEILVGFPNADFISSEEMRKRIDEGRLIDIGKDMGLNTEMVIALEPEAVIGFALDDSDKAYSTLRKNNIPIILNGDWLEETPLGRAEWIKFFGALLDRDQLADSVNRQLKDAGLG